METLEKASFQEDDIAFQSFGAVTLSEELPIGDNTLSLLATSNVYGLIAVATARGLGIATCEAFDSVVTRDRLPSRQSVVKEVVGSSGNLFRIAPLQVSVFAFC